MVLYKAKGLIKGQFTVDRGLFAGTTWELDS